jgi:hypothetical protein
VVTVEEFCHLEAKTGFMEQVGLIIADNFLQTWLCPIAGPTLRKKVLPWLARFRYSVVLCHYLVYANEFYAHAFSQHRWDPERETGAPQSQLSLSADEFSASFLGRDGLSPFQEFPFRESTGAFPFPLFVPPPTLAPSSLTDAPLVVVYDTQFRGYPLDLLFVLLHHEDSSLADILRFLLEKSQQAEDSQMAERPWQLWVPSDGFTQVQQAVNQLHDSMEGGGVTDKEKIGFCVRSLGSETAVSDARQLFSIVLDVFESPVTPHQTLLLSAYSKTIWFVSRSLLRLRFHYLLISGFPLAS